MSKFLVTLLFASVAVSVAEKIEDLKAPAASSESVTIGTTGANWNGPFNGYQQGFNNYPGYNGIPPSTSYGTPLAPPIGPNGVPVGPGPIPPVPVTPAPIAPVPIPTGPLPTGPNNYYRGGFNEYTRTAPTGFARFNGPNNYNVNGWRGSNYQTGYVAPAYNTAAYTTSYNTGAFNPAYNTQFQQYSNIPLPNARFNSQAYVGAAIPSARFNNGYANTGYISGYNTVAPNGGYNY